MIPTERNPSPTAPAPDGLDDGDRGQISEHLDMTARERLQRLLDLLAFEERAQRARVVRKLVV